MTSGEAEHVMCCPATLHHKTANRQVWGHRPARQTPTSHSLGRSMQERPLTLANGVRLIPPGSRRYWSVSSPSRRRASVARLGTRLPLRAAFVALTDSASTNPIDLPGGLGCAPWA